MRALITLGLLGAALAGCGDSKISDGGDLDLDTAADDTGEGGATDGGTTGGVTDGGGTGGDDTGGIRDQDGDGWHSDVDCDDMDPDRNPGEVEECDGWDNDCDEEIDEGMVGTWWEDADGDSYGNPDEEYTGCAPPVDWVDNALDCDDGEASAYPGAEEICGDGIDNDCDGVANPDCGGLAEDIDLGGGADVVIAGQSDDDYAGVTLDAAGDVDGDGAADLLVGAYVRNNGAGAAYLLYGPVTADLTLADADAVIPGQGPESYTGYRVAGAGDVDGDGLGDVLVTTPGTPGVSRPRVDLLQGPLLGTVDLSADPVASILGASSDDYAGYALASADLDGDAFSDVLIGASGTSSAAGAVYLLHGPLEGSLVVDRDADAAVVGGAVGDNLGYNGIDAADLDGDGASDLVVGAPTALAGGIDGGAVYVFFTAPTGTTSTSDADVTFGAEVLSDQLGWQVRAAGDTNNDGYQDLLMAANANDSGGSASGAVYLAPGPLSAGLFSAADADTKFVGEDADDLLGDHITGGGDINNDGFDDVILGALGSDLAAADAGTAWVVYGPATGTFDLGLDADVTVTGANIADYAGSLPSDPMDINDDGLHDVVVGARQADEGGADNGAVYIIFGLYAEL